MLKPMRKLKHSMTGLALLFTVLTASLVACTDPPPEQIKPEITLSVDKADLPDGGGEVTLTAKVTRGKATSVTFAADRGAAIPPVASANTAGDFVAKVTVTATTNFTATATGPAGTGNPSATKKVTVASPDPQNSPKAPPSSSAIKGFTNMTLTTGTPSGLSVVVSDIPGVTGAIDGEVKAETKDTSKGTVTIQAGTNKLEFIYEPKRGATGADSFEYTVTKTGREAKGKISIDIQPVPSNIEVIDGNDTKDTINASSKPMILLTKDITCTVDECIRLDAEQTLTSTMVIGGVTVQNSVKPKIIANIPGTRKSGTASCGTVDAFIAKNEGVFPPNEYNPKEKDECDETKVIVLSDNTTVEGIEITSTSTDEASTYFIALFARSDRAADSTNALLDGTIKIKDVTINRSNGKPIYIQYTFPRSELVLPMSFGSYNLEIDGLDLNDANDTLVIGNPQTLVFKNSSIELLQPKGNNAGPQPFGDNSGVQIVNYNNGGDITLDNVDVYMESPRYRIDFEDVGNNATPIEIYNDTSFVSSVTTNVTVKNSDITFGTSNSEVYALKVKSSGGTMNIRSDSTNNKSVRGVFKQASNGGTVNGNITINP